MVVYHNRTTTHQAHLRNTSYFHHNSLYRTKGPIYFYTVKQQPSSLKTCIYEKEFHHPPGICSYVRSYFICCLRYPCCRHTRKRRRQDIKPFCKDLCHRRKCNMEA